MDSAVIAFKGIEVILNTNRCQAFEPGIFSKMGIDPLQSDVLTVKSSTLSTAVETLRAGE